MHAFAVDEDTEQFCAVGHSNNQTTPLDDFHGQVHRGQLVAGRRENGRQCSIGNAQFQRISDAMSFNVDGQWIGRRDSTQIQRWGNPISRFTQHLWNGVPVDQLPTLSKIGMLHFQSPACANAEEVGKLPGLRKFRGAQRFAFVLAVTTTLVFDAKLNVADNATFELNLPRIRIG